MYIQYIDSSFVICVTKASHYGISFEIWHMLQDCVFCGKAIETFKNLFFFCSIINNYGAGYATGWDTEGELATTNMKYNRHIRKQKGNMILMILLVVCLLQ